MKVILENHVRNDKGYCIEKSKYFIEDSYLVTILLDADGDTHISTECVKTPGPIADVYLNNQWKLAPTDYEKSIYPEDIEIYYERAKMLRDIMSYIFENMDSLKHGIIPQM